MTKRFIILLNNDSSVDLSLQQRWAGVTAAKKMLALRWQPPHTLTLQQWANSLLEIAMMDWSLARMHGASLKTLWAWDAAYNLVRKSVIDLNLLFVFGEIQGWGMHTVASGRVEKQGFDDF